MKLRIATISALLCIAAIVPASAQIHFGAVAGLNFSTLSFDPEDFSTSTKTGFQIGAVLSKQMSEEFTIVVEPMYASRGATGTDDEDGLEIVMTVIELPILFRYSFGTGDIRPYAVAGPELGFISSPKVKSTDGENEEDVDDILKNMDFGLTFGAGATKPIGKNTLFGELRYTVGMANLNDDSDFEDGSIKSSGIQLLFGIVFGTQTGM